VKARIITARAVSNELKMKIGKQVSIYLRKEADVHFDTDPEMLGGIILSVNDNMIDGSLSYQLKKMGEKMITG
jgi:F0F1-type ATP synthase delta subunit